MADLSRSVEVHLLGNIHLGESAVATGGHTRGFAFAARVSLFRRIAELTLLQTHMHRLLRERTAVIRRVAESDEWRSYMR